MCNHIYDLANDCRLKLKDILREPLASGTIYVSPGLLSDNHKKISYSGHYSNIYHLNI